MHSRRACTSCGFKKSSHTYQPRSAIASINPSNAMILTTRTIRSALYLADHQSAIQVINLQDQ
ncbi:Uncharacterised protein [Vibrio cholerae]|uniref:Uncharacterized protein n=1 Tax=Vibrio cholerae TaxID=666 RepID=A0A655YVD8_VIBCL|nr:Uncharacterised protein [Vibrio cholerae]